MITAPRDTLAFQLRGRPFLLKRDMGGAPCAGMADRMAKFIADDGGKPPKPETEALWFYLMNQAVAEVRKRFDLFEPLGECQWVMDEYHRQLNPRAVRLVYYLVLICTRECRHLHDKKNLEEAIVGQFGTGVFQYLKSIPDGPQEAMKMFPASPPPASIGDYARGMSFAFHKGSWSPMYGGKKWGVIADTLVKFITGEINAEVLLDTAWTLQHNTAAIFNKAMLYQQQVSMGPKKYALTRILDVQHSGQIAKMIASDPVIAPFVTPELQAVRAKLEGLFGPSFGGPVDWFAVAAEAKSGDDYKKEKGSVPLTAELIAANKLAAEKAAEAAAAAEKIKAAKLAEEKLAKEKFDKEHLVVFPASGHKPALVVKKLVRAA